MAHQSLPGADHQFGIGAACVETFGDLFRDRKTATSTATCPSDTDIEHFLQMERSPTKFRRFRLRTKSART